MWEGGDGRDSGEPSCPLIGSAPERFNEASGPPGRPLETPIRVRPYGPLPSVQSRSTLKTSLAGRVWTVVGVDAARLLAV